MKLIHLLLDETMLNVLEIRDGTNSRSTSDEGTKGNGPDKTLWESLTREHLK